MASKSSHLEMALRQKKKLLVGYKVLFEVRQTNLD